MGVIAGLLAALIFGANGSLIKVVIEAGLTPPQVTQFRTLGTAILAGLILLATDRAAFRLSGKRIGSLALLGVAGIAMLQWSYAMAIERLPVGIALLFEYLAVLIVALFALIVFKEPVRNRIWVAIGCVLVGLAVVAKVWDSSLDPFGVLMAVIAAITLAYYLLSGERLASATSPMTVAFWTSAFAAAFWAMLSGWWTIDPTLFTSAVSLDGALEHIVLPMWIPLLFVVVVGTFVPMVLSFFALVRLRATPAGILASSEVIFAFVVAWLWLSEALDTVQVIGAAIVLVGIVLAQTARPGSVVSADLGLAPTGPISVPAPGDGDVGGRDVGGRNIGGRNVGGRT